MTIRLGANPIIWSNDDMRELGAHTSLETCLSEARAIGFEGMELGHKFPREPQALAAALEPFGLACVSGWYSAQLLERDAATELSQLRAHLELLKAMGSTVLVLAEVSGAVHGERSHPLSSRPQLAPERWGEFARRLTQLAEATASEGMQLAYHHHMGTVVQSEPDIDRLMQMTGSAVGLLLDTGHARFAGADPVALARRYGPRIRHFHAKDVRAAVAERAISTDMSFLDAVVEGVFTVPGDGCVPFGDVFAALPQYEGWVVLEAEQDPAIANAHTYASLGYRNLRALLAGRVS
jgi:inosose dehydratase